MISSHAAGRQLTIQGMSNLSVHIPNPGDQRVFWNAIRTFPPSDNLLKIRSASAASFTWIDTQNPAGCTFLPCGWSAPDRFPDVGRSWYEQGFERVLATLASSFQNLADRKRIGGDPLLARAPFRAVAAIDTGKQSHVHRESPNYLR